MFYFFHPPNGLKADNRFCEVGMIITRVTGKAKMLKLVLKQGRQFILISQNADAQNSLNLDMENITLSSKCIFLTAPDIKAE